MVHREFQPLQTAQNELTRTWLKLDNRAHVGSENSKDINCLPIKGGFEQCTDTNVFKIFDDSAPSYMWKMFLLVGQRRIKRRSKNKMNRPFRKSNTGLDGLSHQRCKIWNGLHSDLKSAKIFSSLHVD